MCGFFYTNDKQDSHKLLYKKILKELSLRGPDANSIKFRKKNVFLSTRLSIFDTESRSNQPFTDEKKRYFLLFNGAIYNYIELKIKLTSEGVKFNTNSDTEVLFKSLIYKGINKTLKDIKGMFSFIFYDTKKNILEGARDHFGQKPFYYLILKKKIYISSTISSLKIFLKKPTINKDSAKLYLSTNGFTFPSDTFFKKIKSLKAGYRFSVINNKIYMKKYFYLEKLFSKKKINYYNNSNFKNNMDELNYSMAHSLIRHTRSDVPIALAYSGGLDSSLILLAMKTLKKNISTFSNFSKGIEKITFKFIPKILRTVYTNKKYYIFQNKKNYLKDLINYIQYTNRPCYWGRGPAMSNLCQKAKNKRYKVIISGDGMDELSLGYLTNKKSIKNFKNNFYSHNNHFDLFKTSPFINSNSLKKYLVFLKKRRKKYLKISNNFFSKYTKNKKDIFARTLILQDLDLFLQMCTLPYGDDYSMYKSIELRVPYLDMEVVRFFLNQPIKNLSKNSINKPLVYSLVNSKINNVYKKSIRKEGTRNYSKFISNPLFWNFDNFITKKDLKINNLNFRDFRQFFNLINLEIFYRYCYLKNTNGIEEILSNKGKEIFNL